MPKKSNPEEQPEVVEVTEESTEEVTEESTEEVTETPEELTEEVVELFGDELLYDDRDESVGVKFRDAELLGIPLRIVVSKRYIEEGKVEFCTRRDREKWLVDRDEIFKEFNKIKKSEMGQ